MTRAAFLKLPMATRRKLLTRQASDPRIIKYYEQVVKEWY